MSRKMQISSEDWKNLSHRERRRHVNRERRRHKRIAAARQREEEMKALEAQPEYLEEVCKEERRLEEELRRDAARSMLENAAWLERERRDQELFQRKREEEERKRKEKEERERLIREEWEALQRREKEEEAVKEKEKKEKEERLKEALSTEDKERRPATVGDEKYVQLYGHNPLAPEGETPDEATPTPSDQKGTEVCSFFLKTGACRFGDRCSRLHPRPTSSTTLMISSMYSSLGLLEQSLNERDQDVSLEYDEKEYYEDFRKFYDDALPEFSKAGKVVQFKVSCNHEPHLRGNMYVQYSTEEECAIAFQMFNGRWYAQKQLSCEFSPVTKWKSAICGLFNQRRCPKGKNCNFLHVYRNPDGAFSRADRDLPPLSVSPPSRSSNSSRTSSNHRYGSTTSGGRSSRSSRSPLPHGRGRHWRSGSHSRSKSRERYNKRRKHRRSWSRSRSRERSREHRRSYSRSKSRERSPYRRRSRNSRSKSRERSPYYHRRRHSRRSVSSSRRRRKSSSRSQSPSYSRSSSSEHEGDVMEGSHHHHHRHKKHSKKKKKKRNRRSPSPTSTSSAKKKHHHKSKKKHHHYHHDVDVQDKDISVQDKLIWDKSSEDVVDVHDKPVEDMDIYHSPSQDESRELVDSIKETGSDSVQASAKAESWDKVSQGISAVLNGEALQDRQSGPGQDNFQEM